ncbi:MAG: hypothetical protein AAB426_01195, partial [Myxococcota bacterium]
MIVNTDHLTRCIGTLESALTFYERAEPDSVDQEVFRNAIVKGYELAQETALKLVKRALKAYQGDRLLPIRLISLDMTAA